MEDFNLGIVMAQILNFLVFIGILYWALGKKIFTILDERRKHIKASENAEDEAKIKLAEAEKESDSILEEARSKASEIEQNAEELAKQNKGKILERAEKDANYMMESVRVQTEKEKLEMENSMKAKVLNLALKLNSKIFKKDSINKDFIENEYELLTK